MLKKIRNKGTINVLQGGGSAEYGQRPYFYKQILDPSLSHKLEFWVATASLILALVECLGAVCWSIS